MPRSLRWKWIVVAAIVLASVFGVIQLPKSKDELVANFNRNIRLGLDLRGGSHMVLQIQVQDAFKTEADMAIERLKDLMQGGGIQYVSMERNEPATIETAETIQISIKGVASARETDFRRMVNEAFAQDWILTPEAAGNYRMNIRKEAAIRLRKDTLAQSIATIEKKINGLGVAEASAQQRGGSEGEAEILVQLPGVDDPGRIRGILQTAAMLELCEVKDGPFPSRDAILAKHNGVLPLNTRMVRGVIRSAAPGEETWWLLARSPVVTGRDLRDARPQPGDSPSRWDTGFVLSQEAAPRFEKFTSANIGNRLAIILDGVVLSAPTIEGQIRDQGRITGAGTQQEAADLALNLRAGSLPASVKVIEERTVGPSLGADSIRQGLTAGIVGLALVIASMVLYYHGAGLNAVLALLLNTIMTVAALSYIDATWTLPGIAGLVLSIGMAVDSNVLIFERIKEELRGGKAVPAAIAAGFDRALVTIIDTHVTTVVASAFLFMFGTGPVRGFAVTLVIGLVANLFTAVFVSRAIFDVQLWRHPRMQRLSIGKELFKQANIDFLSKRALTLGVSVLAIVVSIGSLIVKGGPKYGLDFRGGTLMYVRFDPMPPMDELRRALSAKLEGEISVQESRGSGEVLIGTELADEKKLDQTRLAVEATLREKYANLGGKLDLNNANRLDLEQRLSRALQAAGAGMSDDAVSALAARILAFRDRDKSGLLKNLDELAAVQGVDSKVLSAVKAECGLGTFNLRSASIVGPRAGEQLRKQALMATSFALGGMLIFIAFRFKLVSGVAAIIATVHDVVITLGLFSLTDREINLNIIAALLTLIGYSMNDKIVVFDRVRENMANRPRGVPFLDLVNLSINQTLSRTILTAGPTLLACLALYFLGGEVLNGIAFALFVGIIVGTYSSIFVASALLVMWQERRTGTPGRPATAAAGKSA